jgi:succinoglycan biosynthesis protein ExoW
VEPRIAVIVPYFQREAGLLRRALSSVAAQRSPPAQVIVVDDGSPRTAADELTSELQASLPALTVVRQSNRGVAAARNAGLDALRDDISAVALLDSDDYWLPSHLTHALAALNLGADFFFANSRNTGAADDYFHQHPQRALLCGTAALPEEPRLVRWQAGVSALFGAGCAFQTPTVVYRRSVMPELRFSLSFRRAGEDQLFFWELLTRSSSILFCTEPTLVIGRDGFGTWQNSTLGSVAHLVRLADEIHLRRTVLRSFPVSTADRRLMRRAIATRRDTALYSALHLLRRRQPHALSETLKLLRSDPVCIFCWCIELPRLLSRRRRHLRAAASQGGGDVSGT